MANEKRLIDANALKKAILAEPWKDQPNMVRLTVDYINIIVDEQPTVDAVEVCRCKDCKHGCEDHEDAYLCNNADYGLIGFTRGDDFCSYGERRNDHVQKTV